MIYCHLFFFAQRYEYKAVLSEPIWRSQVGDGASRVRTVMKEKREEEIYG